VPEATIIELEERLRGRSIVRVLPFLPLKVGVLTTEPLTGRPRERFQATVEHKIAWYGAHMMRLEFVENDEAAVASAMSAMLAEGADLILTAGGNTIDPIDPTFLALTQVGAEIVRFGAPTHPGSMFWLAYRGEVPIFNLASCSMFSKSTVADLVLPWIMTGEVVTNRELAELGYGGLLDRGMDFRFPPYDKVEAEPEEE
jgi:molybdopterin biosynthesis enzyme